MDTQLLAAVETRISRRSYQPVPLTADHARQLQAAIDEYAQPGLRMALVTGDGAAFAGFRKSYGLFSGVENYFVMIADAADPNAWEKLGYYGELLVLRATAMGLGTCWVGGPKDAPVRLEAGERIACTIAVGYAAEQLRGKEKFLRSVVRRKTKSIEELSPTAPPLANWFIAGLRAVQKAPSAVNRQPVTFTLQNGIVTANVKDAYAMAIDLGIAKAHFALAAGGSWEWGNGAAFTKA